MMKPRVDITGQVFGMLTVTAYEGKGRWRCECACGGVSSALTSSLRRGNTQSCGCRRYAVLGERTTTHGMTQSREYRSWCSIKYRCYNPKYGRYHRYGGRGIKVCDRWLNSFENFLADMGERPPNTTIERIDNNGNYEPGNCRWATPVEQGSNTSQTRAFTYNGETKSVTQWAKHIGKSTWWLCNRLKRMSFEDAMKGIYHE